MQIITTTKSLAIHVGDAPVFDPAQPAEPQIERWKAWSARKQMERRLLADHEARTNQQDPDKHR